VGRPLPGDVHEAGHGLEVEVEGGPAPGVEVHVLGLQVPLDLLAAEDHGVVEVAGLLGEAGQGLAVGIVDVARHGRGAVGARQVAERVDELRVRGHGVELLLQLPDQVGPVARDQGPLGLGDVAGLVLQDLGQLGHVGEPLDQVLEDGLQPVLGHDVQDAHGVIAVEAGAEVGQLSAGLGHLAGDVPGPVGGHTGVGLGRELAEDVDVALLVLQLPRDAVAALDAQDGELL
jgi:hypothetical protein